MADSAILDSIASSIATMEGYYQNGSLAQRNNNPGNIVGSNGSFNVYATPADGFAALYGDLQAKMNLYPTYTVTQIMQRYLGQDPSQAPVVQANGNDPVGYASYIVANLNSDLGTSFSVNSTLGQIASGQDLSGGAAATTSYIPSGDSNGDGDSSGNGSDPFAGIDASFDLSSIFPDDVSSLVPWIVGGLFVWLWFR